ncbi:MAG: hypothetical protein VR65_21865 [Desulfobulbaceae bacterium BRH_c16a]|nr:MAG: hypothetical protein VR65_21865 [Desulfobulbaceae bacterium BRH_c16a]
MGIPVGNKAKEELQKFLPAMQKYFDDLFSAIPKTLDDDFKRSFESALVSLAKDNPVLAYKLKNRQCLEMAGHAVQSYTCQLETLIVHPNTDSVEKVVKEEIDKSIEDAHAEILNEINQDIKRVALGCGPVSYFKCLRVLKKKLEGESNFSEFELKERFDLFLAKIVNEVGKKEKK